MDQARMSGAGAQDWIEVAPRARALVEGTPFGFFRLRQASLSKMKAALHRRRGQVKSALENDPPSRQENFRAYEQYFSKHSAHFPLASQLAHARKNGLPEKLPIVELLLSLELSHGLLMGVHDLEKVDGGLQLDIAEEGETFESLAKKKAVVCKAGELVFRDKQGVVASVTQGPDFRTQVIATPGATHVYGDLFWSVMGAPGLAAPAFKAALDDAKDLFGQFADEVQVSAV